MFSVALKRHVTNLSLVTLGLRILANQVIYDETMLISAGLTTGKLWLFHLRLLPEERQSSLSSFHAFKDNKLSTTPQQIIICNGNARLVPYVSSLLDTLGSFAYMGG